MLSREDRFAAPHHSKAATQVCRAAHLLPSAVAQRQLPNLAAGAGSQPRAALVPSVQSAPSNKRLKLTGARK